MALPFRRDEGVGVHRRGHHRPQAHPLFGRQVAIDRQMVLASKSRHGEIDLRRIILARLGLGELHRPARITVILGQPRGLLRPAFGDFPALMVARLGGQVRLPWRPPCRPIKSAGIIGPLRSRHAALKRPARRPAVHSRRRPLRRKGAQASRSAAPVPLARYSGRERARLPTSLPRPAYRAARP